MPKQSKPRRKMDINDRAKQFAPFAALGGYEKALRKAEEEHLEKQKTVKRIKNDDY